MAIFEIKNLSFSYPSAPDMKALDNISLDIEKGQYVTLCGKSGSGKTTLLKNLKTVLAPTGKLSGEILFDSRPLKDIGLKEQSSKIGYVMQNPENQTVTDKVWHELAFGLESLGCAQKVMRARVAEMASYFGIHLWFHKNVSELSGGQKQLLNLASIMAMQPSVLILDEPTSQLDPIAASDFLNTIRKINLELGTTVIISEHRLEEVFHVSDKVIVMENGSIIANDEPRRVGDYLKAENHDMFAAMPSPVRIYYNAKSNLTCPLTVKEGREWLSGHLKGVKIKKSFIEQTKRLSEIKRPVLSLKEVWFRYERTSQDVLRDVNFEVEKGSLHAVVGGNAAGKSTLLKCCCGLIRPYRGKVLIDGKRIEKYKYEDLYNSNVAMLSQDVQCLFVKKTVREDLLEMLDKKTQDKESIVSSIADKCEITNLLDSHPYDLSGGEQQRAALAKVLLTNPQILLLDEPTKGMDAFFKIKFYRILSKLKNDGVTVIMVSHDIEFCAKYADAVSMFFDGSVITTNTPNEFFSHNSFYTTAANRMSRHIFDNAVTDEDVLYLAALNKNEI